MWNVLLTNLVLPLALDTVKSYINSTESKKDDKVLDIVQTGASYLAKKPNNDITSILAEQLESRKMKESKTLQKVR